MLALRHVHRCYVLHTKHTSPVVRLLFTRGRGSIVSVDADGNAVTHRYPCTVPSSSWVSLAVAHPRAFRMVSQVLG